MDVIQRCPFNWKQTSNTSSWMKGQVSKEIVVLPIYVINSIDNSKLPNKLVLLVFISTQCQIQNGNYWMMQLKESTYCVSWKSSQHNWSQASKERPRSFLTHLKCYNAHSVRKITLRKLLLASLSVTWREWVMFFCLDGMQVLSKLTKSCDQVRWPGPDHRPLHAKSSAVIMGFTVSTSPSVSHTMRLTKLNWHALQQQIRRTELTMCLKTSLTPFG